MADSDSYIVICMDLSEGNEAEYVLATRQVFSTLAGATAYADTVSASRAPIVVSGRWHQLRLPEPR